MRNLLSTHCASHPGTSASFRVATACIIILVLVTDASAVVRNGTNTGPIADGAAPNPTCGAPRDVNFAVSNQNLPLGPISVTFTLNHTFVGDLQVSLISPPTPVSTTHLLFSYVGRVPPVGSGFGDSSNMAGGYRFIDTGTLNFWQQAAAVGDGVIILNGNYRTQAAGPFTPVNPGPPFTSINTAFAGVTQPNGNWTLRFLDCAAGDIGTVTAATLSILGPTAAAASISGRVATASGMGVPNAMISVTGGNLETPRHAISNPFGYFQIADLPVGQTYIVTATSKRFFISNSIETITLMDDFEGLNFLAEPF